jgi:hypothetical protein
VVLRSVSVRITRKRRWKRKRGVSTLGKKENSIESPTEALISLGVYVRPSFPTATCIVAALATVTAVAMKPNVEKCMMNDLFSRELEARQG